MSKGIRGTHSGHLPVCEVAQLVPLCGMGASGHGRRDGQGCVSKHLPAIYKAVRGPGRQSSGNVTGSRRGAMRSGAPPVLAQPGSWPRATYIGFPAMSRGIRGTHSGDLPVCEVAQLVPLCGMGASGHGRRDGQGCVSKHLPAICEAARAPAVKAVSENIFQLYMRLSGAPVANLLANRIVPGSHEIWRAACTFPAKNGAL